MFKAKHTGFTLIELLVVMAIIALLVAVLLPTVAKGREMAQRARCAAQLHHTGLSLHMYSQDYREYYPSTTDHRGATNHIYTQNTPIMRTLWDYGWNLGTLSCPSGTFKAKFRGTDALVTTYFYNGGEGDRPPAASVWRGYLYGASLSTAADNMRPVLRVTATTRPFDTALMTDLFRGNNPLDAQGTYIRYVEFEGSTHAYMGPNHAMNSDTLRRSVGLNVLAVDQSVRWKDRDATVNRYPRQYNRMVW